MANDLVVNVGADTSGLEDGMSQIKQNLAMVSDTLMEFGGKMADAFSGIMDGVFEAQESLTKFQNKTGSTAEVTKQYGKEIEDVYKNNWGESLADVADSMAIVKQQSKLLGIDASKDVKVITKRALTLRDTFEFEVNESIRSVGNMSQAFGIKAENAFDLIAKGAQEGLNKTDDLLDTVSEYSTHFARIGLDAEEMFDILKKGSDSGVFTVDQVGDAFHEFGIRMTDMSTSTGDALKVIGLDAKKMANAFLEGGEKGHEAFYNILNGLANIKDPVERHLAGVSLFGTLWEEAGEDSILSMRNIDKSFENTAGTIDEMNKNISKEWSAQWASIKRTIEIDAIKPIGEALLPVLKEVGDFASEYLPMISDAIKGANPAIITAIAAVGGLLTVLLPVIGVVGMLIPAFEAVGAVISSVVAWVGGLGIISTLAGWFSTLGAGISGFVTTIIGAIKGFSIMAIFDSIMATLGGFATAIVGFFSSIGTFISGLSLSGVLSGIASGFMTAMSAIGTALTTVILPALAIIAVIGGVIYAIVNFRDEIWNAVKPAIDILVKSFTSIDFSPIINAFNLLKQNVEPLLSIFKLVGGIIAGVVVVAFGIVVSVINAVVNAIVPLIALIMNLVGIVTSVLGIIVGIVTLDSDMILQSFSTLWENVKGVFINAFGAIKGFVMGFVDSIVGFFTGLYDTLVGHSIIPDMVNAIFNWFRNLWSTGVSLIQGFINGVAKIMYTIASIAYNSFSNFVSTIRNFIGSAASAASSIANSIINGISNVGKSLYNAGKTLMQQVIDGINAMLGKVKSVAGDVAGAIRRFFPFSPAKEGPLKNFPETGYTLMEQLMTGIEAQKGKINDIVSNVTQGVTNNVAVNTAVGQQGNVTIPIYLDGRKITEVVAPYMTKMIKTQMGY